MERREWALGVLLSLRSFVFAEEDFPNDICFAFLVHFPVLVFQKWWFIEFIIEKKQGLSFFVIIHLLRFAEHWFCWIIFPHFVTVGNFHFRLFYFHSTPRAHLFIYYYCYYYYHHHYCDCHCLLLFIIIYRHGYCRHDYRTVHAVVAVTVFITAAVS